MESMAESSPKRRSLLALPASVRRMSGWLLFLGLAAGVSIQLQAETCTTQSQMVPVTRSALSAAALSFAGWVKINDVAGIRASTIPDVAQNFDGIAAAITSTAPKLAGEGLSVNSLYILDASGNSGVKDTQFYCSLNNSAAEVVFSLPALPAARYALAIVHADGQNPWSLSFVLRESGSAWQLAGFISRPLTAAGHDGLWYWMQARIYAKQNQQWNAWLYYTEADALLSPVDFVNSTNRDKLHAEQQAAQPKELATNGVSAEHPLQLDVCSHGMGRVVECMVALLCPADGCPKVSPPLPSYDFTALGTQESFDGKALELAVHITATEVGNPAAVRERNMKALRVLLVNYPELRTAFTGAWVYADAPGQSPFGLEFNPLPPAMP